MKEWFFPKSKERAAELIMQAGFIAHGGSTGILMRKSVDAAGIVDLANAGLDFFRSENGQIEIGAMTTFGEMKEIMRKLDPESILYKALNGSVPNGLINRITFGGSVAMFPMWSDIMGPLLAMDAKVEILGSNSGVYKIQDYVGNRNLHDGNLITKIIIPADRWTARYHRQRRTAFDYSAFSITFITKQKDGKFNDTRIVVIGCRGKHQRLVEFASYLDGKAPSEELDTAKIDKVEFADKAHGSGEYLSHLFQTELIRMYQDITQEVSTI